MGIKNFSLGDLDHKSSQEWFCKIELQNKRLITFFDALSFSKLVMTFYSYTINQESSPPLILAVWKRWGVTVLVGNSSGKDTPFLRIARKLENELATVLTLAGTIGLALAGAFKGDENFLEWLASFSGGLFATSTISAVLGTLAFRKEKDAFSPLQQRVDQAEQDLSVYTEAQKKFIPDELETLFHFLQLQRSERVSIFSISYNPQARHFSLLARYALDANYRDPGRKVYPINEGIVSQVCRGEDYFLGNLPDPVREPDSYYRIIESELNVPVDVASKVVMQSRSYASFGISDFENRLVAALVFESEKPDGLNRDELETIMSRVERVSLKILLARTTFDLEPSISYKAGY